MDLSIASLIKSLGIELNFENLNINIKKFNQAIKKSSVERLKNNPRILTKEQMQEILMFNSKF